MQYAANISEKYHMGFSWHHCWWVHFSFKCSEIIFNMINYGFVFLLLISNSLIKRKRLPWSETGETISSLKVVDSCTVWVLQKDSD